MESIDKLIKVIKSSDEDTARKLLTSSVNKLKKRLIEDSWKNAWNLMRFSRKNKKEQLKKFILHKDEYTGSIPFIDFQRFFFAVLDGMNDNLKYCKSAEDLADEVESLMYLKSGSIKFDRRTLFTKED